MSTAARTLIIAVLASAGFATVGQTTQAASFSHIDRLALEFRGDASRLYSEFRRHYRHTSQYRHLISDASRLYRLADHIHDVAHSGSLRHMDHDLDKLDRAFHHLEDLVDDIHHDAHFGHGHTHGDTRHVRRLMHHMEDTLHHLRDDIKRLRRPVYRYHNHYRHVSPSVRVGNGKFQFRIGF